MKSFVLASVCCKEICLEIVELEEIDKVIRNVLYSEEIFNNIL